VLGMGSEPGRRFDGQRLDRRIFTASWPKQAG
jgi:hypothetical protein